MRRRHRAWAGALAMSLAGLPACAPLLTGPAAHPGTARDAATPWVPAADDVPPTPAPDKPALPPDFPVERFLHGEPLTLADVVKVALLNNPATADAWLRAQAAAAQLGHERAAYLPTVAANGHYMRQQQAALGGRFDFTQTVASPGLTMTWLLLDSGGVAARVDQAAQSLIAANFTQNRVLQDVVLQVESAYFQYLDARALVLVEDAAVRTARASLDAAQARLLAGLATRADVLQARTSLSQAQLARETVTGQEGSLKGALATAMGLPANVALEVGLLPAEVPAREVTEAVDGYLAEAQRSRPDLAAARARALQAGARLAEVRAQFLPTLAFDGFVDRTWFLTDLSHIGAATDYSALLVVRVPLFTGFATTYDERQARAQADDAKVLADSFSQQVVLQVWTSYFGLKTAARRLAAARDLLASATESFDVARGRYTAGVGSILDLLTAQAALVNGQGTEVQSRSQWFLALAQLAHDTGALGLPDAGSPLPAPAEPPANGAP